MDFNNFIKAKVNHKDWFGSPKLLKIGQIHSNFYWDLKDSKKVDLLRESNHKKRYPCIY